MKTIICQCEHLSHFHDETPRTVERGHEYGARCTYVVRVDYGLLVCGTCEKAGHGQVRLAHRERRDPLPCGHEWFHGDPFVVGGCTKCCNEREEAHRAAQEAK